MIPLLFAALASAQVDPRCEGIDKPADYDEQVQQDFIANYVALATTFSAVHAPIPHAPGRGALGFDVGVVPPLPCHRRFALEHTKTEDTNKTPAIPRPRVSFALPEIRGVVPYASVGYLPPVPVLGTRNVILSGELGAGAQLGETWQVGARVHATSHKTVADVATAFHEDDPAIDDLFVASTFGADLLVGLSAWEAVTPFASVGFTDVSTFFYVGDDGVVVNNLHPYAGAVAALGADALIDDRWRLGGEIYAAPGGWSRPDPSTPTLDRSYGHLVTVRLRMGIEL